MKPVIQLVTVEIHGYPFLEAFNPALSSPKVFAQIIKQRIGIMED